MVLRCLTLRGHRHYVQAVALSPDGRLAISGSLDRTLKIWDLTRWIEKETIHDLPFLIIRTLGITADSHCLIAGALDSDDLYVLNLVDRGPWRMLHGHTGPINAVVPLPNPSRVISAAQDGTFKIWDLEGGEAVYTIRATLAVRPRSR